MSRDFVSDLARHYPTSSIREMFVLAADFDKYPAAKKYETWANTCNGEPNFDTPRHIVEAGIASLNAGETKYHTEWGLDELRDAIADKCNREIAPGAYRREHIIATTGGVGAVMLAMMTLINPGDEVILPDPAYTCYEGQILSMGGVPVRVPMYEENDFIFSTEDLEAAITDKTKAILINFPSNPLGAVMHEDRAREIAKIVKKHDLILISDEVYEKIVFDGYKHFSMASIDEIRDNVIIVNSFSKTYAMTGWRLGYVACTNDDINANIYKMQQSFVSCLPIFIMRAGVAALTGPQDCVEEMRQHYERRRNLLIEGVKEIPGMKPFVPVGSFCSFINIKELGVNSRDFAIALLKEAGVLTVAGSAFGSVGEGYLRMCFASSDENIVEACKRIKEYVSRL